MADQQTPNPASQKSQAEGDRPIERTDEQAGGITNRPLDQERENQEAVPDRGTSRPGAHAGHSHPDREADR